MQGVESDVVGLDSSEAADSPRSTVLEQVANGVSVRMAVLYLLLAGERDDERGREL